MFLIQASNIKSCNSRLLAWCNSCMSCASSTEEHFGSSVAQYFSAFSIQGISCWLRFWYICQWATLPVKAELRSLAREHKLSHCLLTLDNLVLRAEVSRDLKFWDIPLASFSKFSRVIWFSATSPAIACNCSNKNKCEEMCWKIAIKRKLEYLKMISEQ